IESWPKLNSSTAGGRRRQAQASNIRETKNVELRSSLQAGSACSYRGLITRDLVRVCGNFPFDKQRRRLLTASYHRRALPRSVFGPTERGGPFGTLHIYWVKFTRRSKA